MRLIRILLGLTKKKECIIKKSIRLNNLFFYKIVNRFTVVNRCIISTLQYCIIAPFHSPFTISHFHITIHFTARHLATALITVQNCIIKIRYSGACDSFVRILPQRTRDCSAPYCVTCPALDLTGSE